VDYHQLRAFVIVAELGSVTSAASRLGYSQPTISKHIRALEREMGLPLFERGVRPLALTREGRERLLVAQAIIDLTTRLSPGTKQRRVSDSRLE
jgi:DNA-binding transcriptional LysR family regulator